MGTSFIEYPMMQAGRAIGINPSTRKASPMKNITIGKNGLISE
jgi:hypothetical protein